MDRLLQRLYEGYVVSFQQDLAYVTVSSLTTEAP